MLTCMDYLKQAYEAGTILDFTDEKNVMRK